MSLEVSRSSTLTFTLICCFYCDISLAIAQVRAAGSTARDVSDMAEDILLFFRASFDDDTLNHNNSEVYGNDTNGDGANSGSSLGVNNNAVEAVTSDELSGDPTWNAFLLSQQQQQQQQQQQEQQQQWWGGANGIASNSAGGQGNEDMEDLLQPRAQWGSQ